MTFTPETNYKGKLPKKISKQYAKNIYDKFKFH